VEADKVFTPVSRENWIKIYDSYHQVKAVIDANPELKEQINKQFAKADEAPAPRVEDLLDGKF
jgi:hypothetical protein